MCKSCHYGIWFPVTIPRTLTCRLAPERVTTPILTCGTQAKVTVRMTGRVNPNWI